MDATGKTDNNPIAKTIEELDYLLDTATELAQCQFESASVSVSDADSSEEEAKKLRNDAVDLLFELGPDFSDLNSEVRNIKFTIAVLAWKLDSQGVPIETVKAHVADAQQIKRLHRHLRIAKARLLAKPSEQVIRKRKGTERSTTLGPKDRRLINFMKQHFNSQQDAMLKALTNEDIREKLRQRGLTTKEFTDEALRSSLKRIRQFHSFPTSREVRHTRRSKS